MTAIIMLAPDPTGPLFFSLLPLMVQESKVWPSIEVQIWFVLLIFLEGLVWPPEEDSNAS